jgi:hypothetical protein
MVGEMALPTHRYGRPIIPSARLWICARAFLSWYHFPINVRRSGKETTHQKGGLHGSAHQKEEREGEEIFWKEETRTSTHSSLSWSS